MYHLIAAMLAVAFCAGNAQAQASSPDAGGTLTLDAALAAAGADAPALAAAAADIRQAEAGRQVAALRPNPVLSTDVENVAGTGPYHGFRDSETTVALALPLELGGKRSARIAVAGAQTRRAQIDLAIARADLRLDVTQAYIAAIASERRVAVAEAQLGVATEGLRVARDRVMVGANAPIDEQRAALQQLKARTAFERARGAATAARAALERYTGLPLATLDQSWFDGVGVAGDGPASPIGSDNTLALAAAGADVATADAQLRLARSQRLPDLTISAGTRRLEATNDRAMLFGVSIPLPVFNNGSAAIGQATAARDRSDARQRQARFEAGQAIAKAVADRDSALTGVRATAPLIAAATEAARIARIGYGEGKFDQLVLIDAEQTLLAARSDAIDALAAVHDAEARLARLTTPAFAPGDDTGIPQ